MGEKEEPIFNSNGVHVIMTSNRALDGEQYEKDFVKKLNSNKDHKHWKDMSLSENSDLYFVKVKGNKFSNLNEKKIKPKTDVYIFKQKIECKDSRFFVNSSLEIIPLTKNILIN